MVKGFVARAEHAGVSLTKMLGLSRDKCHVMLETRAY